MHAMRSEAIGPRPQFGRKAPARAIAVPPPAGASDDLRLFATTFAAGFLFVFLIIA